MTLEQFTSSNTKAMISFKKAFRKLDAATQTKFENASMWDWVDLYESMATKHAS